MNDVLEKKALLEFFETDEPSSKIFLRELLLEISATFPGMKNEEVFEHEYFQIGIISGCLLMLDSMVLPEYISWNRKTLIRGAFQSMLEDASARIA